MSAHTGGLVLVLLPYTRGVAFVAFESPLAPLDWGTREVRRGPKNAETLKRCITLIERLGPETIVLANSSDPHGRRGKRIGRLQRLIVNHARGQAIDVHQFTKSTVLGCFEGTGAKTRYEIAQAIASQIEAFKHRLPPAPKPWKNQNGRLVLFDAAALAMTFFAAVVNPLH